MSDTNDWTPVVRRKAKMPLEEPKIEPLKKLTKREAIDKLKVLKKYNPHAVFLYGSTANGNNRCDSDIDVLIIWKDHIPDNLMKIKEEMIQLFNRSVDFVSMVHMPHTRHYYDRSELFIENVYIEGISVFDGTYKDVIYESKLIGKCK